MLKLINRHGFLAAIFLAVFFCLGLLIGPRISDQDADASCLRNFHFTSQLGFSMNCDSPGFIEEAIDPAKLLEKDNLRQSRPGLIYLAHFVSLPISKLSALLKPSDADSLHGAAYPLYVKSVFFTWFPVYLSYEILNFIILLAAVTLFSFLVRQVFPETLLALPLGLLLVFNDLVKAYFWSPHTQMFNVLLPIVCVWGFFGVLRLGWLGQRRLLVVSAAVGLAVLAYPSFTLFLPSIIAPLPWIRDHTTWRRRLAYLVAATSLCLAPSLIWWATVKSIVGSYYQHEVEHYHQVVWILETLRHQGLGELFRLLGDYAQSYFGYGLVHALPLLVIAAMTTTVLFFVRKQAVLVPTAAKSLALAGGFSCLLLFLFLTALGFVVSRLAYGMIPGLLILLALLVAWTEIKLEGQKQAAFRWLIWMSCLAVGVFEVWKSGPLN